MAMGCFRETRGRAVAHKVEGTSPSLGHGIPTELVVAGSEELLRVPLWGSITGSSAASFTPARPEGLYGGWGLLLENQSWVLWCLNMAVPAPLPQSPRSPGKISAGWDCSRRPSGTFPKMMENKVLMSFAFYSTILIFKMYVVAIITGQVRLRKKVSSTFLCLFLLSWFFLWFLWFFFLFFFFF